MSNVFLSKNYLKVLEKSAPTNMTCHFIGFFEDKDLVGIAISQFLDANKLESFGERDKCIKSSVRNFAFKNFCSHVLFMGNNMLTGQNAFSFSDKIGSAFLARGFFSITGSVIGSALGCFEKRFFNLFSIYISIIDYILYNTFITNSSKTA